MFKFLGLCVLAAAAVYGGVLYWPGIFFSSRLERGSFVLLSRNQIPATAERLAEKASNKLKNSKLTVEERKFEVYMAADAGEYSFFAPYCGKSFACLHPLRDIIFVAPADFEKGLVALPLDPKKTVSLKKLLAGEAVKLQIREKMGALSYVVADNWKKEGYPERVASSEEYDDERQPSDICDGNAEKDPARAPYLYSLAVQYMMDEDKLTVKEILDTARSVEPAIKSIKRQYCK